MTQTAVSPIFDYDGAMERMGNDRQLFQDMVDYLYRDGPVWFLELKAAIDSGDLPRVQNRAHSLKGLVSNFGAAKAWHAAASVEDLARSKRTEAIRSAVEALSHAMQELLHALTPYRSRREGASSQSV